MYAAPMGKDDEIDESATDEAEGTMHPDVVRLFALLAEHGWSERGVAKEIGAAPSFLGSWKTNGFPDPIWRAAKIADLLGLSLDELVRPDVSRSGRTQGLSSDAVYEGVALVLKKLIEQRQITIQAKNLDYRAIAGEALKSARDLTEIKVSHAADQNADNEPEDNQ